MSYTTNLKFGITKRKKQELDNLSQKVLEAQGRVEQKQAIVSSLTAKSNKVQAELATAETNKATALSNKDLSEKVIENLLSLKNNSEITFNETVAAETKIKKVALEISEVINKLIISAEVINKLGNLIIRKKAMNPLISDELISMVTTAGTDANNAVALTLLALKSVFSAQATSTEAEAAITLEALQSKKLYKMVTGTAVDHIKSDKPITKEASINGLLEKAYKVYVNLYDQTLIASRDTTKQLNNAKRELSAAQANLNSIQAGLAAANAAALAS